MKRKIRILDIVETANNSWFAYLVVWVGRKFAYITPYERLETHLRIETGKLYKVNKSRLAVCK